MADSDRNNQPLKPMKRRNNFSPVSASSPANHTESRNPSYSKHSNANSNRSTIAVSNCSRNDNDDLNQVSPSVVGTCPFMCPVEEREMRERLRDLSVFERLHGDLARTSHRLAVKKFCRTISTKGVKACDVRSIPVLEETLNHLLNLLHDRDHPFEVVHDFIFDRTRSIRQDLSMQNVVSDQVIHMYERMAKFHIISQYHLRRSSGTPDNTSLCHLNAEQLMKVLTTLLNLYEPSACHNEAEFSSFYLLLHLGSRNQGEALSVWFRHIPSPIMKSREIHFTRSLLRHYRLGNYRRFICIMEREASFLQYCLIEPYIHQARVLALSCINYGGYKLQPYPLVYLSKLLMMKESEVESLCIDCGLEICNGETGKGLLSTKESVIVKQLKGFHKYYPIQSERIERLYTELSSV